MKKILIVAKKEFLDSFRDKRTLLRMILIPLLAFPLIINLVTSVQSAQSEKEANKILTVGYFLNNQSSEMLERMGAIENFNFKAYSDSAALRMDVKDQIINLGMCYGDNFDRNLKAGEAGKIELFYRGADEEEFVRFEAILKEQKEVVVDQRLAEKGLSNGYIEPFEIVKKNQSTFKEIIGKYAGGILPYIFMSFCFMGCMLPAIDLFAGEKERGTIETLLTTPVNRMQILTGKMIVVVAFGLVSATVALVGLFLSLQMVKDGGEFIALISDILTPSLLITLYLLLIPIAIFFAGIMIPISVYSRSFKEAQSILTPLNVAVIIPTLVGFIPGMELDYTTAFIPIVNVVLATKAVIAGNAEILPLLITFVSLLLLSAIAILISFKQFGKEENILR